MQETHLAESFRNTATVKAAREIDNLTLQDFAEHVRNDISDTIARYAMYDASVLCLIHERLSTVTNVHQAFLALDALKQYYTELYQYDINHGLSDSEIQESLEIVQKLHRTLSCMREKHALNVSRRVQNITEV